MFPRTDFLLVTTVIVITVICYIVLLAKLKPSNELSENFFYESLQETEKNLSPTRRTQLLEKIKEERIKEYWDERKRK